MQSLTEHTKEAGEYLLLSSFHLVEFVVRAVQALENNLGLGTLIEIYNPEIRRESLRMRYMSWLYRRGQVFAHVESHNYGDIHQNISIPTYAGGCGHICAHYFTENGEETLQQSQKKEPILHRGYLFSRFSHGATRNGTNGASATPGQNTLRCNRTNGASTTPCQNTLKCAGHSATRPIPTSCRTAPPIHVRCGEREDAQAWLHKSE